MTIDAYALGRQSLWDEPELGERAAVSMLVESMLARCCPTELLQSRMEAGLAMDGGLRRPY